MPWWKRSVDVFGGMALIIMALPFMLATALVIKISSKGPIFFIQKRVGYMGRVFRMYKFRSMKNGACQEEHQKHIEEIYKNGQPLKKMDKQDGRLIPFIGRFIRRTSIDELPQLFNVLKGEMSLVGPRPCTEYEAKYLPDKRFACYPGITGLWQVSGKNLNTLEQMIKFDSRYAEEMSLGKDLLIMAKTPAALIAIAGGIIY